ncbi:hypothetical protein GHI93_08595 [Lactococcus hircilactis]|uniref:Uncharacterized protein n=1 Tax=Lactococcus hircilactis TaxID=1494462 RepID=A0A7X2D0K1_9LACT|nr:hypothetical protein [Lactococcus hircilactis]MQW39984.1 hypothetical protein [Lactococcus hircilactis]
MKAQRGNQTFEVWKISHDPPKEAWVVQCFEQGILEWSAVNEHILLFPRIFGGAAAIGFYLIKTDEKDFQAINSKRFHREFQVL